MHGFLFRHDDQRCRSIVTRWRVAHGQDTVFTECRLEVTQIAQIDAARFFIIRHGQWRTFPLRHIDRHDFTRKDPGRNGFLCAAVTFQGEVVNLSSCDPVLCRTELAPVTHMKIVIDIPEAVFD